jgi:hypothetical protein
MAAGPAQKTFLPHLQLRVFSLPVYSRDWIFRGRQGFLRDVLILLSLPLAGAFRLGCGSLSHSDIVNEHPAEVEAPRPVEQVVQPIRITASLNDRDRGCV